MPPAKVLALVRTGLGIRRSPAICRPIWGQFLTSALSRGFPLSPGSIHRLVFSLPMFGILQYKVQPGVSEA